MSFVRIWVHLVFSTRNREPLLDSKLRSDLIVHIKKNCREKDIFLDSIGGWSDHLHLLVSLGREQNISKVVMLIKGESAHWVNQQELLKGKFRWQDDYYAISVSESQVPDVRSYIARQEVHHKAVPHEREIRSLQGLFGLKPADH